MQQNSITLIAVLSLVASCGGESQTDAPVTESATAPVTAERLVSAANEPANWMSHGRTYDEQRFSTLDKINAASVGELGLAWFFDVPTERGMEATPVVVDGRMYVTGSWSIVYALDAATGKELWRYDPKVPQQWGAYGCCDAVNRGVAVWGDSVFLGTFDGYLVSLDAETGKENWRTDTIDRTPPYTITGAPRVINGLVMIGNGGAEFGVRGYFSAYDAETGEMRWRFYTVPGNPADGFENDAMKMAAETWTGEWWKYGGGATAWDSIAYDPELDLMYVGTGNGSPWSRKVRSPDGGDNLFVSSIIALRPDTGEYVWHYQTTPGDTWDYTATQHMILADIEIGGETRKVLMQAPKNGFFYVLDRTDGSLISADAYVNVNWATGVDLETGRPDEAPGARYENEPFFIMPSPLGGHNWHPMAYNPSAGLVYVPTQDMPFVHAQNEDFEFDENFPNTGTAMVYTATPDDPEAQQQLAQMISGQLIAWDPVAKKEAWRFKHAGPWNGGVLATAGDIVFQGSLVGEFAAYDAKSGDRLWVFPAQTGVAAAPSTYAVEDEQYVAVAAGWGTSFVLLGGEALASMRMPNKSRILAFKLGGDATLPQPEQTPPPVVPEPPPRPDDEQLIAKGKTMFYHRCWFCHGDGAASGGSIPDLRYSTAEVHQLWDGIVLGGARFDKGMPAFGLALTKEDTDAIHAYVIDRAWRLYEREQAR
jgi:PQQ-dependent dehydrogenase (methanol/ethanol family)